MHDHDLPTAWHSALDSRSEQILHVRTLPKRSGETAEWPEWVPPAVRRSLIERGIVRPWAHQAAAADLAWRGRHVAVATGTASGKSLAYVMPALSAIESTRGPRGERGATVLYLAPTKALAHDQARAVSSLEMPGLRIAAYDGDSDADERAWARAFADWIVSNPDMLHRGILPRHHMWRGFLKNLRFIVLDESHTYRGLFGSHVGLVLRRLLRVARSYGAEPIIVAASATAGDPAGSASRLTGEPFCAITEDSSPRGAITFGFLEPPLLPGGGENSAPTRRSAVSETSELLTDLVAAGVRTLAFARSRRGVESVARRTREALLEVDESLPTRVAAYRGGYLPEERRALETALRSGELLGVAATNALELGIDVSGLDAVLICGWPGSHASLWQQAGRAGREGQQSLVMLIARDDPLDTFLATHPEAVFDRSIEVTVCDPGNPYVLGPHLCAAAAELPLREGELTDVFGPGAADVAEALVAKGMLRHRPSGYFWTRPEGPADHIDLRGIGGGPVRIVETGTGRLLGTVDRGSAKHEVHEGAVYTHQGQTHLIRSLDLDDGVAMATVAAVEYSTAARSTSELRVHASSAHRSFGPVTMRSGTVDVTERIVSFLRRRVPSGQILGEEPLDLPPSTLRTSAVWWELGEELLAAAGLDAVTIPGAIHAAEHACIGLLPLFATCDRWDIGGLSTPMHPDTGHATIFIYDGHPGGAGFADRGFRCAEMWLGATLDAINACLCLQGCPSCVQSPKCGNGNEPLDKAGASRLLSLMLGRTPVWSP